MVFSAIGSMNPDIEKFNKAKNLIVSNYDQFQLQESAESIYYYDYSTNVEDLATNNIKSILNSLFNSYDDDIKISKEVLAQSFKVLDILYPSMLNRLAGQNIYSTRHGTVIFDWANGKDVFSLEIGKETIGYFIEVDSIDIKQVDSEELIDSAQEMLHDLQDYLDRFEG